MRSGYESWPHAISCCGVGFNWFKFIALVALMLVLVPSLALAGLRLKGGFDGEEAGDQFGICVAGGGDMNNDGYDDIAVGASAHDNGGNAGGKVYVYLGAPLIYPWKYDASFVGTPGSFAGSALDWAGDLDNDGYDDLAAGAKGSDVTGVDAGAAFILLGGDPVDSSVDIVIYGSSGSRLGEAICGCGDLNGDGYDDLAVGAPRDTSSGMVYVYLGGSPMDTIPDYALTGDGADERFGFAIACPGDVNADGWPDILVGAPRNSEVATWAGKAYLFQGGPGMDEAYDLSFHGEAAGDEFGTAVNGAGNVDLVAGHDFLISAPYYNAGFATDVGRAYLFSGGASLDSLPDLTIDGSSFNDRLGFSLDGTGDLNGDTCDDFMLSAIGDDSGGSDAGAVYFYWGGALLDAGADSSITGEAEDDQFGYSVSGAGDTDSTGAGEVLMGSWSHAARGRAYLYGDESDLVSVGDAPPGGSHGLSVGLLPNPGKPPLKIAFSLARPASAVVEILDASGRLVRTIRVEHRSHGAGTLAWDGRDKRSAPLAAGVYLMRLKQDGKQAVNKAIMLR